MKIEKFKVNLDEWIKIKILLELFQISHKCTDFSNQ